MTFSTETNLVLSDHLGSSDAIVNGVTGALNVQESFAPFGQRRQSNWQAGLPAWWDQIAITESTRHGFTSHEHLDNVELIHMNGRVYDPTIGRFLSVDPVLGDRYDSQRINPYAYVNNRPLVEKDPTGFDPFGQEGYVPPETIIIDYSGNFTASYNHVDLDLKESFGFLGFDFRRVRARGGALRPQYTPKLKKRTELLRKLREVFRRYRSQPVTGLVATTNPILRGWVRYFAVGHSGRCFSFIKDWVEKKIRRHMMRARKRSGFGWRRWSSKQLHARLGLFNDYRVVYFVAKASSV
jgi:RHS repeat-associated protein